MIFIVVKVRVRPEFADQWGSLTAAFTEATRAEPGNLFFEWARSLDEPNVFVLTEGFRDAEAGAAHVASEHFALATRQLADWVAAVPEIINVEVDSQGWSRMSELPSD